MMFPFSNKEIEMKKLIMMLVLFAMAFTLSSCNMLRGAGRDVEHVGDSIEHAAS
jgi:predicted small secreted protein